MIFYYVEPADQPYQFFCPRKTPFSPHSLPRRRVKIKTVDVDAVRDVEHFVQRKAARGGIAHTSLRVHYDAVGEMRQTALEPADCPCYSVQDHFYVGASHAPED